MAEYDKTNTGTLNKNDKGDNEKRPDYKGKIDIEGTLYWLSGWIREGNDGKFLSLKALVDWLRWMTIWHSNDLRRRR